ncbi:MAG: DUF4432 family protein [Anaerolineales bacterium]|nr:DUF4432 family protein [Anaerolineales bacterium]
MFTTGEINGHLALRMENELLSIVVLPRKGADIYSIVYKPKEVDFLMKTPGGLQPPGEHPPSDFLENYEGGWQELFPNPGDAVTYHGVQLPFHGEAALLPWQFVIERDDAAETTLRCWVDCQRVPFRLEKLMRLRSNHAVLDIEAKVQNVSDQQQYFLWGQHIVLGGDFLRAGCRMEIPAATIITPMELYEPATASLAPGQREPWPCALGRLGEKIDLRHIPGPEAHWHDDIYLTDLEDGHVEVTNPDLKLCFRLEWDANVFGCLVNWRPLGGAEMPPLTGIYGLGIEPWVSRFNLTEAIQKGEALSLQAGEMLQTNLRVTILADQQDNDL